MKDSLGFEQVSIAEQLYPEGQMRLGVVDRVVTHDEFLEQYTGILALGQSVISAYGVSTVNTMRASVLRVMPWSDSQLQQHGLTRADFPHSTRERAEKHVEELLGYQQLRERYKAGNKLRRATMVARYMLRKNSIYLPSIVRYKQFPDIIISRINPEVAEDIIVDERFAQKVSIQANNY